MLDCGHILPPFQSKVSFETEVCASSEALLKEVSPGSDITAHLLTVVHTAIFY